MTTLALLMTFIPLGIFLLVMLWEPRTLWSGISFFILMMSVLTSMILLSPVYVDWLGEHEVLLTLAVLTFTLAVCFVVIFPVLLIFLFLVEGFRLLRREGFKASNLLSLLFAVMLCAYLVIWPLLNNPERRGGWSGMLYGDFLQRDLPVGVDGNVYSVRFTQPAPYKEGQKRRLYHRVGSGNYGEESAASSGCPSG